MPGADQVQKNATVREILARLPQGRLATAVELAGAIGMSRTERIYEAIEAGELEAVRVGRYARISRSAAEKWLSQVNSPDIG